MIQEKMKNLWQSKRKECILCLVVLLLVFVSLSVNMGNISKKTKRAVKGTAEPRKELFDKQAELQKAIDHEQELSFPIQKLANSKSKFWINPKNNPQYELRRKIEQAAKSSNVRLKSIGTVENVKITEGFNSYDIAIAADCKIEDLVNFIAKIEEEQPRIFWKSARITPDNIRAPNLLVFNGSLRILVLTAPEMAELLWGEK